MAESAGMINLHLDEYRGDLNTESFFGILNVERPPIPKGFRFRMVQTRLECLVL